MMRITQPRPSRCRHCHVGSYPAGHYPAIALTECPCRCHVVDTPSTDPPSTPPVVTRRNGKGNGKGAHR
jgi:hypothetical protein